MLEDILVPIFGCITAITIVSVTQIIRYKLKVEQIKADAMVRAEEIRAKNQLELERMIHSQSQNTSSNNSSESMNFSCDNRTVREKHNQ